MTERPPLRPTTSETSTYPPNGVLVTQHGQQNFLADLDEPQYDLVERPGKGLTNRLTCIRCRGPRRNGDALCRRCRWSPRRAWRLWRNR